GENDRARELYERAYGIFLECDDPSGAGVMLSAVADLQREAGDPQAAIATCDRAMEQFEQAGMPLDSYMAMTSYAEALAEVGRHADGDVAGAYRHLQRSCRLTEQVSKSVHDQRVRALRVRFEVELAERDAQRYREQAQAQAAVIAELERTRSELANRMAELERLNAEIVQLSQTDPLTGIA